MRTQKWPNILFKDLAESFTHISCDTSTILTILSEITWDPENAAKNIPVGDRVLRDKQLEHERNNPRVTQLLVSDLLRSGLRLAIAHTQYKELQQILDHYAGPKERKRYRALVDGEILQVFLDDKLSAEEQSIDATFVNPRLIIDSLKKTGTEIQSAESINDNPDELRDSTTSRPYANISEALLAQAWAGRKGRSGKPLPYDGELSQEGQTLATPTPLHHTTHNLVTFGAEQSDPTRVDWTLFPKPPMTYDFCDGDVELLTAERNKTSTPQTEERSRKRLRLIENSEVDAEPEVDIIPLTMTLTEEELRIMRRRDFSVDAAANRKSIMLNYLSIYGVPAKVTRTVLLRHIKWLNASFRCNFLVLTGDSALINALKGQRIHLDNLKVAFTHPPRSLAGC